MADVSLVVQSTLNITCMKNDSFSLDMNWTDSNGDAIDMTLYNFKVEVKKSKASSISVLTFNDSDFSKDSSGNLTMTKSATDMNVESSVYYYDLQTTEISTSVISTWLGGRFTIQEDVTT